MGKSKDLFGMLRSFKLDDVLQRLDETEEFLMNLYGDLSQEDLEEEQFEVTKGNYKTVITYRFNKKGYPVSYSHKTESIGPPEDLEALTKEQNEAIKNKDFKLAGELQQKMDKLKKTNQ